MLVDPNLNSPASNLARAGSTEGVSLSLSPSSLYPLSILSLSSIYPLSIFTLLFLNHLSLSSLYLLYHLRIISLSFLHPLSILSLSSYPLFIFSLSFSLLRSLKRSQNACAATAGQTCQRRNQRGIAPIIVIIIITNYYYHCYYYYYYYYYCYYYYES